MLPHISELIPSYIRFYHVELKQTTITSLIPYCSNINKGFFPYHSVITNMLSVMIKQTRHLVYSNSTNENDFDNRLDVTAAEETQWRYTK